MAKQLHKKFSDDQIKELLERDLNKKIKEPIYRKFQELVREDFSTSQWTQRQPIGFSVGYIRKNATNKIAPGVEEHIMAELEEEKRLIRGP